jgi:hypothetical protein
VGAKHRASHDSVREAPEETFVSSEERRKMWKDEWTQSALPNAPDIPGWHLCWLSTTNSYDGIDKRIRLGYVPVKAEDVKGFENYRVKAGEHVGYIACNEMLLFKIPMDQYPRHYGALPPRCTTGRSEQDQDTSRAVRWT